MTTTVTVPLLIRGRKYAEIMGLAYETVRHQVSRGTCEVQPCKVRPYRWRAADVKHHIETSSAVDDRRTKDKAKRQGLALVKQQSA